MLLRLQREGVHVDTRGRRASVVLPRLHLVEVRTLALGEAVLSVQLHLRDLYRVLALALHARRQDDLRQQEVGSALEDTVIVTEAVLVGVDARARGQTRARRQTQTRDVRGRGSEASRCRTAAARQTRPRDTVALRTRHVAGAVGRQRTTTQHVGHDTIRGPVIGVVERLLTRRLVDPRGRGAVAVHEGVALHNPDQLLHGVVEVHLDLVGGGSHGLVTRELDLVDQVLVALLGEAAALLSVQVHIVHVQGRGDQLQLLDGGYTITQVGDQTIGRLHTVGSASRDVVTVAAVVVLLEVHVDADLVVLQSDQGDRQTGVAAVPELQGDVQRLHRGTRTRHTAVGQLRRSAGGVQRDTVTVLQQNQVRAVAHHLVEGYLGAYRLGQLGPDLHPVTILTVDTRATDLNLNLLNQAVTHVVQPAETVTRRRQLHLGQRYLDVSAVHQVRVTADDGSYTATEVRLTVEGHLNRLHGEVGVSLVQHLPEGDLGVAGDVDVLSTIAYKLH